MQLQTRPNTKIRTEGRPGDTTPRSTLTVAATASFRSRRRRLYSSHGGRHRSACRDGKSLTKKHVVPIIQAERNRGRQVTRRGGTDAESIADLSVAAHAFEQHRGPKRTRGAVGMKAPRTETKVSIGAILAARREHRLRYDRREPRNPSCWSAAGEILRDGFSSSSGATPEGKNLSAA